MINNPSHATLPSDDTAEYLHSFGKSKDSCRDLVATIDTLIHKDLGMVISAETYPVSSSEEVWKRALLFCVQAQLFLELLFELSQVISLFSLGHTSIHSTVLLEHYLPRSRVLPEQRSVIRNRVWRPGQGLQDREILT